MNHIDLFSGVGGFSLAASWVWPDHNPVLFCEREPFCQKVLRKHWPDVPIVEDVSYIDEIVNICYSQINLTMEDNMAKKSLRYEGAKEMYLAGSSIQQCADYYGISRQAMWDILKRRGVVFRPNKKYGEENHFFRGGGSNRSRVSDICERAIESGLLIPQPCEICGRNGTFQDGRREVQAHHDDYNFPLRVRWLCQKHHHEWHLHNKPIQLKNKFTPMKREEICSMGGKKSWENLTAEQRTIKIAKMHLRRKKETKEEAALARGIDLLTGGFP